MEGGGWRLSRGARMGLLVYSHGVQTALLYQCIPHMLRLRTAIVHDRPSDIQCLLAKRGFMGDV